MRCPAGRSLDADPRSSLSSVSQKRNREEGMWNSIQVGFTERLRNVYKSAKVKWTPTLASRNSPAWQISIFQAERACALSLAVTRDDDSAARWMFGMPINYTLWNGFGCVYFTSILEKKKCKDVKRRKGSCLLRDVCLSDGKGRTIGDQSTRESQFFLSCGCLSSWSLCCCLS